MSMNDYVKAALKDNTFERCGDTKLRETLKDAIPMLDDPDRNHRKVKVQGVPGRIWMRRVADHGRAGIEIMKDTIP
jgi:hypothetical protein